MSNEIKVGILAAIAIGLSIWGFNYLAGINLFSKSKVYKVEYSDVMGLTKSAPVYLRGYKVGLVSRMYLNPDNPKSVIAELDINSDVNIPKGSVAALASGGIMSGQVVVLEIEGFCEEGSCLESGGQLRSRKVGMVESLLGVDPSTYIEQAKNDLPGMLDTINNRIADPNNEAILAQTMRDVQQTTENLQQLTSKLDILIGQSSGKFDNILTDMQSLTSNLQQSNGKITSILDNTNTLTSNLSRIDMNSTLSKVDGTLSKVDGTLGEADEALGQIKSSLATADQALKDVNALVAKMNEGEGTIGKLLSDDQLAIDLQNTLREVAELSQNLDEKPYEYIPFKSKRKVMKYRRQDAANN